MITIDFTITVGTIIETFILTIGGLTAFISVQMTVKVLKFDMHEVQNELKKLTGVLVGMADMRGELRALDVRVTALDARATGMDRDIRELRHGEGIVTPRFHDRDRDLDRG